MASSVGRIALGVVGAVIGAPFGLSAIGFSIGSAIGGMLFAPDGPTSEGPRLGDTNVSASSLGKVIIEHYGVTRASGNMVWSGGLKEIKKKEKQGGGKGGGGGSTTTTYHYYASFAHCLGRGPAKEIRKIWADGKIIYDGSGESDVNNDKYTWRLVKGEANEAVDPLIAESINRRLAGLPDVNEGNGPQAEYTTLSDLIATAAGDTDPRSQLYAAKLSEIKTAADAAVSEGGVPDYGFTPAYRGLALLIFDDMSLEDFGNRIPNITAEVVWDGASEGNGAGDDEDAVPVGTDVTEISPAGTPDGFMAVETDGLLAFGHAGGTLRRFNGETRSEDRQAVVPSTAQPGPDSPGEYGYTVDRLLGVDGEGRVVATGTRHDNGTDNDCVIHFSSTGLEAVAPFPDNLNTFGAHEIALKDSLFGAEVGIENEVPQYSTNTYGGSTFTAATTGAHFAFVDDTNLHLTFRSGEIIGHRVTVPLQTSSSFFVAVPNTGPVVGSLNVSKGEADIYTSRFGSNTVAVSRYRAKNNVIKDGYYNEWTGFLALTHEQDGGAQFSTNVVRVAANIFDANNIAIIIVAELSNGSTGIARLSHDLSVEYVTEIPNVVPPLETSGLTRSDVRNGTLAFASGRDIISIGVLSGRYDTYSDILAADAARSAQIYISQIGGLFLFEGGTPRIYSVGSVAGTSRDHDIADNLPDVITDICRRAGMLPDEFDVSGVSNQPVRGYSIARPSTGRQTLETLMQAYFVDGIETDWKIVFRDRSTDSVRTIEEKELGSISGPTGQVNWLESRTPEYDIPSEININYSDPVRDYQTNTAHKRRIANPIPSMYSNKTENIELPMVMKENEAAGVAERLLYLSWMSRDSAKTMLNWTHADLDPGDVISVKFNDGRIVTDRIAKATLGANFEIEVESVRSGDPVYEVAPQTIIPTGSIPSVHSPTPVSSEMFVLDMPLLFDYHETGRASARYYTAVGSSSPKWGSATIFNSWDGSVYLAGDTVNMECTWGEVLGTLKPPRALWTTDHENTLRVAIAKDQGDLASVTRDEILNGANKAFVFDRATGVGEIIQFQNVTVDSEGVYTLSTLTRGLRGTDYAAHTHGSGETFILLDETEMQVASNDLSRIGQVEYFKAVSAGQLISAVPAVSRAFRGRSLMPHSPVRVRRSDNGSDLTITWVRRTRVGGGWDMVTPSENTPLSEDFEQYELYLLPTGEQALEDFEPNDIGSYYEKVVVSTPTHTFSAADLAAYGLTLADDINVAIYQVSAQVGRGFPALGKLAP